MPHKKSRIVLYADENIAVQTVTHLRSKGISIIHCFSIDYVNKKDELHFKKSKSLNRVLLSLDKDFKKFKGIPMNDHPGIILITSGSSIYQHINDIIDNALKHISLEYVRHSILRISMSKIVKEKEGKITEKIIRI